MADWELAVGDKTRDYADVMLHFGVAILGPGHLGPFSAHEPQYIDTYDETEIRRLRTFMRVGESDRIVLHRGQREMLAIGRVVRHNGAVHHHSNCFADVDGWDLQHFVKVDWIRARHTFGGLPLAQGTIRGLTNAAAVQNRIAHFEQVAEAVVSPGVITEPDKADELSYDDVEQGLITEGARIADAENIVRTIERVEKLTQWYRSQGIKAGEHEIRTFLVAPLLDALGWSPQRTGIEVTYGHRKLDMVLYRDARRQEPTILVETKKMNEGSAQAVNQAIAYISSIPDLQDVQYFCVSDGFRYWLYSRDTNDNWSRDAYMNFANKRKHYTAYPNVRGMHELLIQLHQWG